MSIKLITAPANEPLTLAEVKAHLRVDDAASDALITALIVSAREMAEHQVGRSLMQQTLELTLDQFPDAFILQRPPVISITSVKYLDADGIQQTLAAESYVLDNSSDSTAAYLICAYATSWPTTRSEANAVRVRYLAGYANAAAVPQGIKQWMLLQIGHWFATRESTNVGNIVNEMPFLGGLLDRYRIYI